MLFRQTEKVPDVGKNNFRDFVNAEKESVKKLSRTATQSMSTYQTNPFQLILDGSCKASGSTWDAKHLDAFINTTKYGQRETYMDTMKEEPLNPNGVKESFYFRNKFPRFDEEKNGNIHFFKTQINHLVTRPDQNEELQEQKKQFVEKKLLHAPKINVDKQLLQYTPNPDEVNNERDLYKVTLPSQKRQDILNSKKTQQEFQQARKHFFEVNRANRTAKCGFRSGILNIDNPEMKNTLMYQEEQQKIQEKRQKSESRQEIRKKQLQKFIDVNPGIEYDNCNFKEPQGQSCNDLLLGKKSSCFPQKNYEMHQKWVNKNQPKENYIEERKNTSDRIFGNNLNQIKAHTTSTRAMFLRSQEQRGRDYNIIALTKHELQSQQ